MGSDVSALALDAVHSVAFHTGLGSPLYPSPSTPLKSYLDEHKIAAFADSVYAKSNIALIGDGATTAALSKWTEQFFKSVPASSSNAVSLNSAPTTYFGGESRSAHTAGNALIIAFPGASFGTYKAEVAVLAALLGGHSSVKWTPGFSLLSKITAANPGASAHASNLAYSDAGLFTIQVTGAAGAVRTTAQEAVKALKSIVEGGISKEDLAKAIAKAKFDALAASEAGISTRLSAGSGIVHTGKPFQIAETIKSLEGVTADKLKTVSGSQDNNSTVTSANLMLHRLPSRSLMERLPLPLLVTCTLCHMLRSLVLRYRLGKIGRNCTNISAHCCKIKTSTCAYSKFIRVSLVPVDLASRLQNRGVPVRISL